MNQDAIENSSTAVNAKPNRIGSRRAMLKNGFGILTGRIISIGVSFVAVPIVIAKLGMIGYGVWESIIALSILSNIFQATISGTLLWKFSEAFGANDRAVARQYLRIGIFVSLCLFAVVTPVVWICSHPLLNLFKVPTEFSNTAIWVFPMVVGVAVLGSVNEVLGALLSGSQCAAVVTLIQAVSGACNYGIVVAGLLCGLGLESLAIGFVSGFVLSFIGLFAAVRFFCGPFSLVPQAPSIKLLKTFRTYSGFMLLHSVAAALRDQADKVVLCSVASPIWSGYFGIAARLTGLLTMACQFLYVPATAAAGALSGSKDWPGVQRLYVDTAAMFCMLIGFCVLVISALHERLILLWLGKLYPEATPILFLLMAGTATAIILTGAGTSVCKGLGAVKPEAIYIVIGLVINIILKFTLVPLLGGIGTVLSSSLSWVVSAIIFLCLLHKFVDLPGKGTRVVVKTLLVVIALTVLMRAVLPSLGPAADRRFAVISLCEWVPLLTIIYLLSLCVFGIIPISWIKRLKNNSRKTTIANAA